jgi:hypothetical protein
VARHDPGLLVVARRVADTNTTRSKKGDTQNIYLVDIGKFASLHIVGNTCKQNVSTDSQIYSKAPA